MLILPESVYDARARLAPKIVTDAPLSEQTCRQLLELDEYDYIGLIGLGGLRRDAGDFAEAERYFWRAIEAHPCISSPYVQVARLLHGRPESAVLSEAFAEMGIAKRSLEDDDFVEGLDFQKAGLRGKPLQEFRKLPAAVQGQLIAGMLRAERDEPEAVKERMRPLRLLHQVQVDGDLDRETVDEIIAEGDAIVPLLVGVLRDWVQDLLGDEGEGAAENALALLGEIGSPAEIPHLLEFADLSNSEIRQAAQWAFGRIVSRRTEEAARFLGEIAAGLGVAERVAVADQILRYPALDPAGELLTRLSENLGPLKPAERDSFFPAILGAMAIARGKDGVKQGRAALSRQGGLLSRHARRDSEELLAAFTEAGIPPTPLEPPSFTVYEICAGNAVWPDDEEEGEDEEDEEFLPPPEPIKRKAAPGRNDPCWCGSGKKYKKCHLDSDDRTRLAPPGASAAAGLPDEFAGLRERIGDFLGETLTKGQLERALEEFADDAPPDREAAPFAMDWIVHDREAPVTERTIMQEFLRKRGARLTDREREMVEAWSRTFVGLYEVQSLKAGVGVGVKDVLTGETLFVHDVNSSRKLVRWDGLLARVAPGERGAEFAGLALTVPRQFIQPLREWMEEDREETGTEWPEYLKRNWPRVRRRFLEMVANWRESLQLANTDGEELLFSKSVYRISDEAAALGALRNCPELDDADGDFVWLNEKKTVLGNIRLDGGELTLECNSRQRMERGKQLLAELAGEALRHARDEFTTQKELKRKAMEGPRQASPKGDGDIPKEELDAVVARYLEDHYGKWPDIGLPALGGKTPREAVRTASGRRQTIAVLKDIENGEERKRKAGEPFYDVSRLRAELGLKD